jgi:transcriptional regulator with XRE-family HTH domain
MEGQTAGARIRAIRLEKGISQSQLARATGVLPPQVSALERSRQRPGLKLLVRLARGLSVPLRDFHASTACLPSWPEGAQELPASASTGERLLALRQARGLTQLELSEASGVLQQTVSRIEASKGTNISWPVLIALASALNVNLDAFVGE